MQAKFISLIEFIKKHKERFALVGMGIAFIVFIGGGIYLQKNNKQEKDLHPKDEPVRVELPTGQQKKRQMAAKPAAATTATYYLKPAPDEILQQLASMNYLKADVIKEKFSQLPVLWPAYFFTIQKTEDGRSSLVLDVSEDGFGAVIESEIDIGLYPQLQELKTGQKVWIGGKILGVDPAGTGKIYLKSDQYRIGDEAPFLQIPQPTKQ